MDVWRRGLSCHAYITLRFTGSATPPDIHLTLFYVGVLPGLPPRQVIEGLGTRLYKLFVVFKKLCSCVISTVRFQLCDQCGAYIGSAISLSTHLDSFQEWKLEAITKIGPPSFAEWGAFLSRKHAHLFMLQCMQFMLGKKFPRTIKETTGGTN